MIMGIRAQSIRGWMRLGCLLLPLVGAGCSEGRRAAVEGEVTYDGQPVAAGTLRLFPLDGTPGFGAEAPIVKGRYSTKIDEGLFAGRYRLEVRATKTTGPIKMPSEDIPGMSTPAEFRYEYLPADYNDQSTLEVILEPGENRHPLKLTRDVAWESQREKELPDWVRAATKKGE